MADETPPRDEPSAEEPKYNQDFFITLALKGKDAWNAWRRDPANEAVRVTFAGIDFSEAPRDEIDFSGFEFGHEADFMLCKWRGGEWEKLAKHPLAFTPGRACFTGAIFGARTVFTDTIFSGNATFVGTTFGGDADFTGAAFGDLAYFHGALFKGRVEFAGKTKDQWTGDFAGSPLKERYEDAWKRDGFGPDRFLRISFANARFDCEADFSGRSFERGADFTNVRFNSPPDFDAATGLHRIDFSSAHIGFVPPGKPHWTSDTKIPIHLRAFRKIAEDTKNHDLERDLYIEERKAERGIY